MAKHDEDFNPEMLDGDVEHLLSQLSSEDAQLVHGLRKHYSLTHTRSTHSTERAWERIQQERLSRTARSLKQVHTPTPASIDRALKRKSLMNEIQSSPTKLQSRTGQMGRIVNTLVAVLLLIVVVGGMALIANYFHSQIHTATGRQKTIAAPTPDASGIYTIDTTQNAVLKYDTQTHAILWKHPLTIGGLLGSPIFVQGNTVYVTAATTSENDLYALNAQNGSVRWQVAMNQYTVPALLNPATVPTPEPGSTGEDPATSAYYAGMLESPMATRDTVYIMARSGKLVALNAANGKHLWTYDAGITAFVHGTIYDCGQPTVMAGIVYGTCENVVFAVDAQTGVQHWKQSIDSQQIFNDPVAVDGNVYLTSYIESQHNAGPWQSGGAYAYNGANGTQLWQKTIAGWVLDSPTVVNGVCYFGSNNHNVYALKVGDGSQLWKYATGGVAGHTVVNNGVLYVAQSGIEYGDTVSGTPSLIAIQVNNGQKFWEKPVNYSPIAAQNGVLYVIGMDGFGALNGQNGTTVWHISANAFDVEIVP